jgi:hypothetical protein
MRLRGVCGHDRKQGESKMKLVLTCDNPQKFYPFCMACNWRKGGVDSWDGFACKCGFSEPLIEMVIEGKPVK